MIPLFWPTFSKTLILDEISDTLDGRWLGQGPKVEEFEQAFAKEFGYPRALFLNSCTAALELAYHLIGLSEGDEVIVPVLNCTAGQTGLVRRGVKIVFADIEQETLNVSLIDIKRKITAHTRAIVGVHLGGIPFDDSIYDFAEQVGIPVITDSAQHLAHTRGDYICYSFQAIKHMTTGDGGMLICKSEKDHESAKKLRWFGIDRELKKKHDWQAWERREMTFDIEEAGYKFQPTDIDACFGLAGLKLYRQGIIYRERLVDIYRHNLKDLPLTLIAGGSFWLFGILTDRRDELAEYLKKYDIEVNLVHLRNDIFRIFEKFTTECSTMDSVENKYLYLPLNTNITGLQVVEICNRIKEFYAKPTGSN